MKFNQEAWVTSKFLALIESNSDDKPYPRPINHNLQPGSNGISRKSFLIIKTVS